MPLPKELRNSKKGLINLKNEDDKCFLWCHVRHLNPQKDHPYRIKLSDKEFAKKLDYSGITFPVTIKQIAQIERQNEININLLVMIVKENQFIQLEYLENTIMIIWSYYILKEKSILTKEREML